MGTVIKGLQEIKIGEAQESGADPEVSTLIKIGMVYKETCEFLQDDPSVTEFYEEGESFPFESTEEFGPVGLKAEIVVDNPDVLSLIGGSVEDGNWSIAEGKSVKKYVRMITAQGKDFVAPNCKMYGKIVGKLTSKDILRVLVTFTPNSVENGKPFRTIDKEVAGGGEG